MLRVITSLAVSSLLLGAVVVAAPSQAVENAPVAHTQYGDVGSVANGDVVEWRAVPYAAPPVGDLRWRPPQPPEEWTGVRLETEFADQCAQLGLETPVEGSEDCLYLNVFAPSWTDPTERVPVMVHLHGGSNFFFRPYRDASAFVERGVIVVTVGYRLGVFGFAGHPALTEEGDGSSGEYGVLDQIAALEWVQENISAFGGDPSNVTLFGESAGSFDAVAIAASPLGDGLFARLAAQTEAIDAASGRYTIDDAEDFGIDIAAAVGCGDSVTVLACLRDRPAEQLVIAAGVGDVPPWVGGHVLPAPPLELIESDPTPVPMLVGSNREESAAWFWDAVLSGDYPRSARAWDFTALVGAPNLAEASRLYPVQDYESSLWATIALASDAVYTCPIRRLAFAAQQPVYRYLYTHTYENDPFLAAFRARHFWDDPILWNDPELIGGYEFSAAEELLSDRMADYWTNFAKTGNPNGPGLPVWPVHTEVDERILALNTAPVVLHGYHIEQCEFLDENVPAVYAPTPLYTPAATAGWGAQHPTWWR